MKPLLLDILACPICKYYPLKLVILKWETLGSKFSKLLEAFHKKNLDMLKNATKIRRGKDLIEDGVIINKNNQILLKDEIVRKETDIINYLKEIESKLENFDFIEDYSDDNFASVLNLIKSNIVNQILDEKEKVKNQHINDLSLETQNQILEDVIPSIYLLNWFFQFSEIEEGVIFCENCSRWYPIIDTIPQMLPDDLREKELEIGFLKKWESKISNAITEKGKPFNLQIK